MDDGTLLASCISQDQFSRIKVIYMKGDLVVMSLAAYEQQQQARLELYEEMTLAEQQGNTAEKRISHEEMMNELRNRLHG